MDERTPSARSATARLLDRLTGRARLALLWERLWPVAVAALIVLGAFIAVSWLGLWLEVPRWARGVGLGLFAAAFLWPAWLLTRFRPPKRAEALARVDRDSGVAHRPASALDDRLANADSDPATRALWAAHRRRAEAVASALKVAPPRPRTPLHDRFAVRAGVLLAVVAAGFVAGPQKYARLAAAFDFNTVGSASQGYRLDVWIDPPGYTGRPPMLLRTAATDGGADQRGVEAPAGSTVVVRTSDGAGISAEVSGGLASPPPADGDEDGSTAPKVKAKAKAAAAQQEQRWVLRDDATLTLTRLGSTVAQFDLVAIPDRAPVITLNGEPRANARGSLTLGYKIEDDYGVASAEAEFTNPRIAGQASGKRSLVEAPRMPLGLPAGTGEAETTADLSEHPWAGARVTMTLVARDEGANTGRSEPVEIVLPQRPFVKPLARALVEQRRRLALDPDDRTRVGVAMEALMIAPDRFGTGAGPYLGLRTIYSRLAAAETDDDLRAVADLMWEMALRLEEGDLSEAERDLRAAQQALREALERNASEDEIRRLMNQLRAALDKFLQELAERQTRDQDQADQAPPNPNERIISSDDLKRMLDQMEQMARSGDMADAQRMLDQLQNMLENLRTARRRGQDQMTREMNRSLNQLDQMMRDQQELRDQTFQESQRNGRQQNRRDERGDNSPEALQRRQEALRQQLEDLQRRMRQFGMKPEEGFGDAQEAMREAEQQLGKGQEGQGEAVDAQGRALEGLRKGAQSLAQQMQPGGQASQGDPNGPGPQGRNTANPDPLGRESHNRGDTSRSLFDPPGAPAAQRAQRVLEELRRRLSDPSRPREELDYLERLLRRY